MNRLEGGQFQQYDRPRAPDFLLPAAVAYARAGLLLSLLASN